MSALLTCDSLSFSFQDKVLFSDLSFQVQKGDFWAITGPSGVGKTTLLKNLTGELVPQAGHVKKSVFAAEVPQGLSLTMGLSALENISTGDLKKIHWLKSFFSLPRESLKKAKVLGDRFHIKAVLDHGIESLSGGEKQRVALARALMQLEKESGLLIADEPISMLDQELANQVLANLKNHTLICVLHQLDLVEKYATHILNLDPRHEKGWKIIEGKKR